MERRNFLQLLGIAPALSATDVEKMFTPSNSISWTDVTASRLSSVTYTNTTGEPLILHSCRAWVNFNGVTGEITSSNNCLQIVMV